MPRLNPDALTFGTFTSSNPPVEQVIQSARGLEALGFDHIWSGDQLQYQHPHQLWRPDLCDGARANPKLGAKFALQPLMSVLGQHTRRVCIGQGVLDAIRRRPAILAQEFLSTQHFALCNYVGFISRADAPAATRELLEVARGVRVRFPDLATLPRLLG